MVKASTFVELVKEEEARLDAQFDEVQLMQSRLCDVKLAVTDPREEEKTVWIGSNKQRLMAQSEFFRGVWTTEQSSSEYPSSPLSNESVSSSVEELSLSRVSATAMRAVNAVCFQRFHRVDLTVDNLAEILYAALKYGCQFLLDCCEQLLREWSKDESKFDECVRTMSDLHKLGMTEKVSRWIDSSDLFGSTPSLLKLWDSPSLMDLPIELFTEVIRQDSLAVDEEEIWNKTQHWCAAQVGTDPTDGSSSSDDSSLVLTSIEDDECKDSLEKELLCRLKPFIRFPLLSLQTLSGHVFDTGVLTLQEFADAVRSKGGQHISDLFCKSEPRCHGSKRAESPRLSWIDSASMRCSKRIRGWPFDCYPKGQMRVSWVDNRQILTVLSESCPALFACSEGVSSGVHCWIVTVKDVGVSAQFGVGVTVDCEQFRNPPMEMRRQTGLMNAERHLYCFYNTGGVYRFGPPKMETIDYSTPAFGRGDSLMFILNCDRWTLNVRYISTGEHFSINLPSEQKYHPMIGSVFEKARGLKIAEVEFIQLD